MLGRRGLVADWIAAVRGTMAMRRVRGQVRIELAFAGAAMIVAFVGFYTVIVKGDEAESAGAGRAALGLAADDELSDPGSIVIGDGDGFVVTDDEGGTGSGSAGPGEVDGDGAAAGPGSTGPDGVPVGTPGAGVLPSESPAGDGGPGTSGPGGGSGEGGTATSLPPTSTTGPDGSTPTTPTTSDPDDPGTTPTTEPPDNNLIQALLNLLGL